MDFPVDILGSTSQEDLQHSAELYMSNLLFSNPNQPQQFILPNSKQIPLSVSTTGFVPLYGADLRQKVLALFSPEDQCTAVALYLVDRWWAIEDILKTSDSSREGLLEVSTLGERIVLYVLNRIVYRAKEMEENEVPFLCHSENDFAKVLWKDGEAIGFYSVKPEGSLCETFLTQRYLLPVMDSLFVRKAHRGNGYGLCILEDYVDCFKEEALGLKYPLTPAMYRVCAQYLTTYPADEELLWEVQSVGGPFQRSSIANKIKTKTFTAGDSSSSLIRESMEIEVATIQKTTQGTVTSMEISEEVVIINKNIKEAEGTRRGELSRKRIREETIEFSEEQLPEKINRVEEAEPDVEASAAKLLAHEPFVETEEERGLSVEMMATEEEEQYPKAEPLQNVGPMEVKVTAYEESEERRASQDLGEGTTVPENDVQKEGTEMDNEVQDNVHTVPGIVPEEVSKDSADQEVSPEAECPPVEAAVPLEDAHSPEPANAPTQVTAEQGEINQEEPSIDREQLDVQTISSLSRDDAREWTVEQMEQDKEKQSEEEKEDQPPKMERGALKKGGTPVQKTALRKSKRISKQHQEENKEKDKVVEGLEEKNENIVQLEEGAEATEKHQSPGVEGRVLRTKTPARKETLHVSKLLRERPLKGEEERGKNIENQEDGKDKDSGETDDDQSPVTGSRALRRRTKTPVRKTTPRRSKRLSKRHHKEESEKDENIVDQEDEMEEETGETTEKDQSLVTEGRTLRRRTKTPVKKSARRSTQLRNQQHKDKEEKGENLEDQEAEEDEMEKYDAGETTEKDQLPVTGSRVLRTTKPPSRKTTARRSKRLSEQQLPREEDEMKEKVGEKTEQGQSPLLKSRVPGRKIKTPVKQTTARRSKRFGKQNREDETENKSTEDPEANEKVEKDGFDHERMEEEEEKTVEPPAKEISLRNKTVTVRVEKSRLRQSKRLSKQHLKEDENVQVVSEEEEEKDHKQLEESVEVEEEGTQTDENKEIEGEERAMERNEEAAEISGEENEVVEKNVIVDEENKIEHEKLAEKKEENVIEEENIHDLAKTVVEENKIKDDKLAGEETEDNKEKECQESTEEENAVEERIQAESEKAVEDIEGKKVEEETVEDKVIEEEKMEDEGAKMVNKESVENMEDGIQGLTEKENVVGSEKIVYAEEKVREEVTMDNEGEKVAEEEMVGDEEEEFLKLGGAEEKVLDEEKTMVEDKNLEDKDAEETEEASNKKQPTLVEREIGEMEEIGEEAKDGRTREKNHSPDRRVPQTRPETPVKIATARRSKRLSTEPQKEDEMEKNLLEEREQKENDTTDEQRDEILAMAEEGMRMHENEEIGITKTGEDWKETEGNTGDQNEAAGRSVGMEDEIYDQGKNVEEENVDDKDDDEEMTETLGGNLEEEGQSPLVEVRILRRKTELVSVTPKGECKQPSKNNTNEQESAVDEEMEKVEENIMEQIVVEEGKDMAAKEKVVEDEGKTMAEDEKVEDKEDEETEETRVKTPIKQAAVYRAKLRSQKQPEEEKDEQAESPGDGQKGGRRREEDRSSVVETRVLRTRVKTPAKKTTVRTSKRLSRQKIMDEEGNEEKVVGQKDEDEEMDEEEGETMEKDHSPDHRVLRTRPETPVKKATARRSKRLSKQPQKEDEMEMKLVEEREQEKDDNSDEQREEIVAMAEEGMNVHENEGIEVTKTVEEWKEEAEGNSGEQNDIEGESVGIEDKIYDQGETVLEEENVDDKVDDEETTETLGDNLEEGESPLVEARILRRKTELVSVTPKGECKQPSKKNTNEQESAVDEEMEKVEENIMEQIVVEEGKDMAAKEKVVEDEGKTMAEDEKVEDKEDEETEETRVKTHIKQAAVYRAKLRSQKQPEEEKDELAESPGDEQKGGKRREEDRSSVVETRVLRTRVKTPAKKTTVRTSKRLSRQKIMDEEGNEEKVVGQKDEDEEMDEEEGETMEKDYSPDHRVLRTRPERPVKKATARRSKRLSKQPQKEDEMEMKLVEEREQEKDDNSDEQREEIVAMAEEGMNVHENEGIEVIKTVEEWKEEAEGNSGEQNDIEGESVGIEDKIYDQGETVLEEENVDDKVDDEETTETLGDNLEEGESPLVEVRILRRKTKLVSVTPKGECKQPSKKNTNEQESAVDEEMEKVEENIMEQIVVEEGKDMAAKEKVVEDEGKTMAEDEKVEDKEDEGTEETRVKTHIKQAAVYRAKLRSQKQPEEEKDEQAESPGDEQKGGKRREEDRSSVVETRVLRTRVKTPAKKTTVRTSKRLSRQKILDEDEEMDEEEGETMEKDHSPDHRVLRTRPETPVKKATARRSKRLSKQPQKEDEMEMKLVEEREQEKDDNSDEQREEIVAMAEEGMRMHENEEIGITKTVEDWKEAEGNTGDQNEAAGKSVGMEDEIYDQGKNVEEENVDDKDDDEEMTETLGGNLEGEVSVTLKGECKQPSKKNTNEQESAVDEEMEKVEENIMEQIVVEEGKDMAAKEKVVEDEGKTMAEDEKVEDKEDEETEETRVKTPIKQAAVYRAKLRSQKQPEEEMERIGEEEVKGMEEKEKVLENEGKTMVEDENMEDKEDEETKETTNNAQSTLVESRVLITRLKTPVRKAAVQRAKQEEKSVGQEGEDEEMDEEGGETTEKDHSPGRRVLRTRPETSVKKATARRSKQQQKEDEMVMELQEELEQDKEDKTNEQEEEIVEMTMEGEKVPDNEEIGGAKLDEEREEEAEGHTGEQNEAEGESVGVEDKIYDQGENVLEEENVVDKEDDEEEMAEKLGDNLEEEGESPAVEVRILRRKTKIVTVTPKRKYKRCSQKNKSEQDSAGEEEMEKVEENVVEPTVEEKENVMEEPENVEDEGNNMIGVENLKEDKEGVEEESLERVENEVEKREVEEESKIMADDEEQGVVDEKEMEEDTDPILSEVGEKGEEHAGELLERSSVEPDVHLSLDDENIVEGYTECKGEELMDKEMDSVVQKEGGGEGIPEEIKETSAEKQIDIGENEAGRERDEKEGANESNATPCKEQESAEKSTVAVDESLAIKIRVLRGKTKTVMETPKRTSRRLTKRLSKEKTSSSSAVESEEEKEDEKAGETEENTTVDGTGDKDVALPEGEEGKGLLKGVNDGEKNDEMVLDGKKESSGEEEPQPVNQLASEDGQEVEKVREHKGTVEPEEAAASEIGEPVEEGIDLKATAETEEALEDKHIEEDKAGDLCAETENLEPGEKVEDVGESQKKVHEIKEVGEEGEEEQDADSIMEKEAAIEIASSEVEENTALLLLTSSDEADESPASEKRAKKRKANTSTTVQRCASKRLSKQQCKGHEDHQTAQASKEEDSEESDEEGKDEKCDEKVVSERRVRRRGPKRKKKMIDLTPQRRSKRHRRT